MIETLKTLAQGKQVSILKGNKAYNFKNRTILIFYGSPKDVEPIRNVLANQESVVTLSLPDKINSKWDAPITEKSLYKCRGNIVLFSYYGMKIELEDEQESNDTVLDDKPEAVFIDHSANDTDINNIDSFEAFFFHHIEIVGNRKDCILKEELFEKYE